MKQPARAINIFVNDKIQTMAIENNIFNPIINLFEKAGFGFKVDSKLKMIMVNTLDKKRAEKRQQKKEVEE